MTASATTESIQAFIKRLKSAAPEVEAFPERPPTEELVYSLLLWESTLAKAELALKRIESSVADVNELRVCLPDEIHTMLGERYPLAPERAHRIRSALQDIYIREYAVSVDHLASLPKREARKYLETLHGAPSFVAARVTLLSLGGHAVPVDQKLLDLLIEHGVIEEGVSVERAASVLERHIKAADAREAHHLLQLFSDGEIDPGKRGGEGGGSGKREVRKRSRNKRTSNRKGA